MRLETGDVIEFPHGDPHIMSSAPNMRGTDGQSEVPLPSSIFGQLPIGVRVGSKTDPPDVQLICGFLTCDREPFNPLLAALPRVSTIRPAAIAQATGRGSRSSSRTRSLRRKADASEARPC